MARLLSRRAAMSELGTILLLGGCSSDPSAAGNGTGAGSGASTSGDTGGDTGGSGGTSDDGPMVGEWVLPTPLVFVAGSNNTYNLATTLPAEAPTGGVFAVDDSGTPLPTGMTLSADGVLSVGDAGAGDASDVVFSYTS